MLLTFSQCGPKVDAADLDEFEAETSIVLPRSYRKFLTMWNGGSPHPDIFPIYDFPLNPRGRIQILYSLHSQHNYSDLYQNFKIYQRRLPRGNLPIGNTDTGDVISITILGGIDGAAMLWDHESENINPNYDNMYFIASNFEEFLNSIRHDISA